MHDATYPGASNPLPPVASPLIGSGAPAIVIGFDGSIKEVSPSARQLMDHKSGIPVDTNFFSLVHKNQLYPVMRDVADIVCRGKVSAHWLLRLRTASGSWRWFKAEVRKSIACPECINLILTSI